MYFFKSWGTYSHPVKPIDPMEFEDAIKRDGYYRAWMCKANNKNLFVFFEGIELSKKVTNIHKTIKDSNKVYIYKSIVNNNKINIGRELNGNDTIKINSFLVSFPDGTDYLVLVEQKSVISYEYKYSDNGKLQKVFVKDFDGNIKTIDYE